MHERLLEIIKNFKVFHITISILNSTKIKWVT
jgi:hypothetical protein